MAQDDYSDRERYRRERRRYGAGPGWRDPAMFPDGPLYPRGDEPYYGYPYYGFPFYGGRFYPVDYLAPPAWPYSDEPPRGSDRRQRDFWDKAGDEVASWFGDEDAEHRREIDRHRGKGPKGYKRSDERISEEIHERLTVDPHLDATDIEVTVKDREVTLDGLVDDRHDRRRAEELVEWVSGVEHVQNNLRVRPTGIPQAQSDVA